MRSLYLGDQQQAKTAVLIKEASFNESDLMKHYFEPLLAQGVSIDTLCAYSLCYGGKKKPTAKHAKAYMMDVLQECKDNGITSLLVADTDYFKKLAKVASVAKCHGEVVQCEIEGFEDIGMVLVANYAGLYYNPDLKVKIDSSVATFIKHLTGTFVKVGHDLIKKGYYPESVKDIANWLQNLTWHANLTADIETKSLKFYEAGIATVAFAWDSGEGVAFTVDTHGGHGEEIRKLLKEFFENYEGTLIWHNANYDLKILIYELWMDHPLDQAGLIEGLNVVTKKFLCTKVISYLATNSATGNDLSLKALARDFAGNWAEDVKDVTLIPRQDLLEYNLKDCLATYYVYERYLPIMIADDQQSVHDVIMHPSIKLILQTELTGFPMDAERLKVVGEEFEIIRAHVLNDLYSIPLVKSFVQQERQEAMIIKNAKLVKKVKTIDEFKYIVFNPASVPSMQRFLYKECELPVIDLTDGKQPATGNKTLKKLVHQTHNSEILKVLGLMVDYSDISIMLDNFISNFNSESLSKADGRLYLHGSFNLGGTKSGRLSSSAPNMQNMPSTSRYAKDVKSIFVPPEGWLLVGIDFNSLEDYVSALTTRDRNKMKVYIDKFDGHSLRAFSYWPEKFPFDVITPELSHMVKDDDELSKIRSDSKPITFMLTYGGTYIGLMQNLGFSEVDAKSHEANYHALYVESDEWVAAKIKQACNDGYVTMAFGLRMRTPILARSVLGLKSTPYPAEKEARTAGNGLGQSYGMLNNRAGIEFQDRVLNSEHKLLIKPVAPIHDAQYFLIKDDIDTVKWFNDNVVECVQWQNLPELKHDVVKIGGAVDLFYKGWHQGMTIPNNAAEAGIREVAAKIEDKYAA